MVGRNGICCFDGILSLNLKVVYEDTSRSAKRLQVTRDTQKNRGVKRVDNMIAEPSLHRNASPALALFSTKGWNKNRQRSPLNIEVDATAGACGFKLFSDKDVG